MADTPELWRSRLELLLEQETAGNSERLFALFDAARIPGLPVLLKTLEIPHSCLFRGEIKEDIAHVAPYIARLTFNSVHFEWLKLRTEDAASALFGISDAPGPDVFTHLRRFLMVLSPDNQERLFRFWDPRIIPPFLEASTEIEKRQFFGPIQKLMTWNSKFAAHDSKAVLLEWPAPPASPVAVQYPDAHHKFRFRPPHEAAFGKDALERYDERCIEYLRSTHASRLQGAKREEIHTIVVRARETAPTLGIVAGRDVTTLAEVILIGLTPEIKSEIAGAPAYERSRKLIAVRDRLSASGKT